MVQVAHLFVTSTELRERFAARLSALYGTEVPAYTTLVEVSQQVNRAVLERSGADAERLGSIERVTAERHGAIRVGTPRELGQVARVFAAMGMAPVGFYDLRDAQPRPIPVVSTAFRPVERAELARNPFRVFTSVLVPEDRRFFDPDLERRLRSFLDRRELFPPELLELADAAERDGGLDGARADRFLDLATGSFALSREPVDRVWYAELEAVSSVAADIGGVPTTHINHLTPRVLDIDALYEAMQRRGVEMIDKIQGPPRWDGPDLLLRQTSFRALAEPRLFREPDGTVHEGSLRVRFGEVEARGIAPTPAGRALYNELDAQIRRELAESPDASRQRVAERVWTARMPRSEAELARQGLAYFRVEPLPSRPSGPAPTDLDALVSGGYVRLEPIVYEDFLPQSAAGIFSSNLTGEGRVEAGAGAAHRDPAWLAGVVGRDVHVPEALYAAEAAASLDAARAALSDRA